MVAAIGSCETQSACCDSTEIPTDTQTEHDCLSFCFCSCCGSSVFFDVKKEKNKITNPSESISFSTFFYKAPFSTSYPADIWQPPKSA